MPSYALPLVCIVICNFNKRDDVVVAIESVQASRGVRVEIIVVDNCSSDGSAQAIEALPHQNIQIIRLLENIGGSGGFRVGMEASKSSSAEFVLLLDNDASVAPDTITGLVDAMKSDPELGAVGPAILKAYSPGEVQDVGGFISANRFSQFPGFNGLPLDKLPKERLRCEYLASCCLLTRRQHIEQLGGFQSNYFIYWDDIDWCTRLAKNGYGLMVCPELKAWHKGGLQSAKTTIPAYFNIRNRLRFFSSHKDLWNFSEVIEGIKGELVEVFAGCLTKGNMGYIEAHKIGIRDGLDAYSGSPRVDLPPTGSLLKNNIKLTPGASYLLELDDWFSGDSFDIKRQNNGFKFGDFYKLSRLISCLKGLKSQCPIRLLLSKSTARSFNIHEYSILEDYVEFTEFRAALPKIKVYRHLIDMVMPAPNESIVVDSYLNLFSSHTPNYISRASSLVDNYFRPVFDSGRFK